MLENMPALRNVLFLAEKIKRKPYVNQYDFLSDSQALNIDFFSLLLYELLTSLFFFKFVLEL